jgi:dipeptidyl aminopeptidase/acylaminoacyl peptidase
MQAAAASGRCERVIYAVDGLRVVGFVVRPEAAGPHPVILWLRGGNRDFGAIEPLSLLNLLALADRGFVVVATQYRGVDGGEGREEFGGDDVHDVLALVPLARSLPEADVDRLFVLGGSRGAMQGLLAIKAGLPVRAAAFRGGLYDLEAALAHRPGLAKGWGELIPGFADRQAEVLVERSAIRWPDQVRVPVLLLHGNQDWRSQVSSAADFARALEAAGVETRLVTYDQEEHQLVFHRQAWLDEVAAWFRAHGA